MTMNASPGDAVLDAPALSKLRWRCRRGLLENDLFIARFFARHESALTAQRAQGLLALMDLGDLEIGRQCGVALRQLHQTALRSAPRGANAHGGATPPAAISAEISSSRA